VVCERLGFELDQIKALLLSKVRTLENFSAQALFDDMYGDDVERKAKIYQLVYKDDKISCEENKWLQGLDK